MKTTTLVLAVFSIPLAALVAQDRDLDARISEFEGGAPAIGSVAPDFSLPGSRGAETSLSSLAQEGPVVIEFANLTSPGSRDRADREDLVGAFGPKGVRFVVVYIRETGAGDWVAGTDFTGIAAPANAGERRSRAEEFQKGTKFQVVVDRMDDRVLESYGGLPGAVFVVAQGTRNVVFRDAEADGARIEMALTEMFESGLAALPASREEKTPPKEGREDRPDGNGGSDEEKERRGDEPDRLGDEGLRRLAQSMEEMERKLKTPLARRMLGNEKSQQALEGVAYFRKAMIQVSELPDGPRREELIRDLAEAREYMTKTFERDKGDEAEANWEKFKEKMGEINRKLQSKDGGGNDDSGHGDKR